MNNKERGNDMSYQFVTPEKVIYGENALLDSMGEIAKLGSKALIVTGKNVTASGVISELEGLLSNHGVKSVLYNDIVKEPTIQMILDGVRVFDEDQCDFVIGIGGGSPMDSAKAISAMTVLPNEIQSYMGKEILGDFPPVVLIPTTTGTGSEATKYTIITDEDNNVKMLLKGDSLLPKISVLDFQLVDKTPGNIVVATAMDALTHAIEAYVSRKATPITNSFAESAVRKIFRFLPMFIRGENIDEAKGELLMAAFEAGICINNASVTIVHGMSRPIGALFHIPHGISNAILLGVCMNDLESELEEEFANLGQLIGCTGTKTDSCKQFLSKLDELCQLADIKKLKELGVNKAEFDLVKGKMAEDALASKSPDNAKKTYTKENIILLYDALWKE